MNDTGSARRGIKPNVALDGTLDGAPHEAELLKALADVRYRGTSPVLDKDLCILTFFNRSGSNFLGELLAGLPGSGGFGETINWNLVVRLSAKHKLETFPDYIRFQAEMHGGAGLWGVKASAGQLSYLLRWNIPAMFRNTRIIHIRRNDLAAQAVSLQFASHTGEWSSQQKQEAPVEAAPVPYDLNMLRRKIRAIQNASANIEVLTTAAGLPLQTVVYEHLLEHPGQTMAHLAEFLDIDVSGWTPPETRYEKQASDAKSQMVARLREDLAEIALSDTNVSDTKATAQ